MEDFHPVTLFIIAQEMFGPWLWVLIAAVVALLLGILSGIWRLRATRRPFRRPLLAGLILGLLAMAVAIWLLPGWSAATFAAFNGPLDYLMAVLLALIPGLIVATAVFSLAAHRCASRAAS